MLNNYLLSFLILLSLFLFPASGFAQVSISCPANITVSNSSNQCEAIVNYTTPVGSGSGTGITTSLNQGLPDGSFFPVGSTLVEYIVTNEEGDTASCSFNVSVNDTQLPTISCPPDITVNSAAGSCGLVVFFDDPLFSDNCPGATLELIGGLPSGSIFPVGENFVDFEVTDASGNIRFCRLRIFVLDVDDPVIVCPADLTYTISTACDTIINYTPPVGIDDCTEATTILTSGPASGSTFSLGLNTIEYTVTDLDGNSASCSFSITILESAPPIITCPDDIVINVNPGECNAIVNYSPATALDLCSSATVQFESGLISGSEFPVGETVIEYSATDESANVSTCSFTVLVVDDNLPDIICPDSITVNAASGFCSAIVNFNTPTAIDSCSDATVSQTGGLPSGSEFPVGLNTVEFTATDLSGNTSSCELIIEVIDVDLPAISCPVDLIVPADPGLCEAIVNYALPIGSDDCTLTSVQLISGIGSGGNFPIGSNTEVYEVSDEQGNTDTCSFAVIVIDEEAPVIICPSDIAAVAADGDCEVAVSFPVPVATDNCSTVTLSQVGGPASGDLFPLGNTLITFTGSDEVGNIDSCSFTISVTENVLPEINCPADIVVDNDPGICGAIVSYSTPIGTDNCGGAQSQMINGLLSGQLFPPGTTLVEYMVNDLSGNTAVCSFNVTVNDIETPLFDCIPILNVNSDPGLCEALVNYTPPTATDNCSVGLVPILISGSGPGSVFPLGSSIEIYEVTDDFGNSSTCEIEIIVSDNEAPLFTCPADIALMAASGDCDLLVNYADPIATDNCAMDTIVQTAGPESGTLFPVGTTLISFLASDVNGNTSICSFNVIVTEDIPPTITCPADISVDSDLGICGAIVNYNVPVGVDNCGNATTILLSGFSSGSEFPVGVTTVEYQVSDISENLNTCSFTVTVSDVEAPIIDCPLDFIFPTDTDVCEAVVDFSTPVATDNCSSNLSIVQTEGPLSGSIFSFGSTVITYEYSDEAGNTSSCTFTVVVVDESAPVFTNCNEDILISAPPGDCMAVVDFDTPDATDNCSASVLQTGGFVSGSEFEVGNHVIEFTATDEAGNESICTFLIIVSDDEAPLVVCPEDISSCDPLVFYEIPTASDNCGIESIELVEGLPSGSVFPIGETDVVFDISDDNGNVVECSFVIEILPLAPEPDAGEDRNICGMNTSQLEGSNPGFTTGTWTLISGTALISDINDPNSEVSELAEGENIFVWALDPNNGCEIKSDTIVIFVEEGVSVNAGNDVSILFGGNTVLHPDFSPVGGSFLWEPNTTLSCSDCENPIAEPEVSTVYSLTYTSALGCMVIDSLNVFVLETLPNAITPDNDGVNDVWNIPHISDYPDASIQIFNRWGEMMFESTGYREPWDGTYKGEELPTGSYFYVIDYRSSGKENNNGTVSIIR